MDQPKTFATKESLLNNRKRAAIEVDGLGLVGVRELSGRQIREYNERVRALQAQDPKVNVASALELLALLASMSACDEQGALLFTEEEAQDLADISFEILVRIGAKALELSGMGRGAEAVAAELKNALTSSSVSDLQSTSEKQ